MLNMNVHPGSFNFIGVLSYKPIEKYGPPRSCLASFIRVVEVVIHSPAEVSGQADVKHFLYESG